MSPFEMISVREEIMISYCLRFVGLPYRWGGDDPLLGFDCSGFSQEFLMAFGAHPRPGVDLTAQGLYDAFFSGAAKAARVGALAFYGASLSKITHVAVLIGPDLIFEFGGGGSQTLSAADAVERNAYGRIRPLKGRRDFLTCLYPRYP